MWLLVSRGGSLVYAQPAARASAITPQQAIDLAQHGHCKEASRLLQRMLPQLS